MDSAATGRHTEDMAQPGDRNPKAISAEERALIERWVRTWQTAGPVLEEIRRREVAEADYTHALEQLAPLFNDATRLPPRTESGLVEMQRWFAKLREKQAQTAK
jgi:hypothetical protein